MCACGSWRERCRVQAGWARFPVSTARWAAWCTDAACGLTGACPAILLRSGLLFSRANWSPTRVARRSRPLRHPDLSPSWSNGAGRRRGFLSASEGEDVFNLDAGEVAVVLVVGV